MTYYSSEQDTSWPGLTKYEMKINVKDIPRGTVDNAGTYHGTVGKASEHQSISAYVTPIRSSLTTRPPEPKYPSDEAWTCNHCAQKSFFRWRGSVPFPDKFRVTSLSICARVREWIARQPSKHTNADSGTYRGTNSYPDEYKASFSFIEPPESLPL